MHQQYWQKQGAQPLFPDLQWSRPEMTHTAGKLLIIGGNVHGFAGPATAYAAAQKAGIGTARVVLPNMLEKSVRTVFPGAEYAPSTPSGSFATNALAELLAAASWADGVLLAGDIGRNSETAAIIENFAQNYHGQLTIAQDCADLFCRQPNALTERPKTLLVLTISQLQQLGVHLRLTYAFTATMGTVQLVEQLHDLTLTRPEFFIAVSHQTTAVVAVSGNVSTTALITVKPLAWAASAATWWLQNPAKPFEALTTSLM